MKKLLAILLLIASLSAFCACGGTEPAASTDENTQPGTEGSTAEVTEEPTPAAVRTLYAADDSMAEYVKFNGRTYFDETDGVEYFPWSLGGFEIRFTGTGVQAELWSSLNSNPDKNTYLYVYLDGADTPAGMVILNSKNGVYPLCAGLEEKEHTLKLVKRNDVSYASAGVRSIEILGSEKACFGEKPADKDLYIEFVGDSITSGDGCMTLDGNGSYISKYQDATKSYAAVSAKLLNADASLVSRCGVGVVWDSSKKTREDGAISMPYAYDYACVRHDPQKELYDFSARKPDLIVVNLGTNDRSSVYTSGVVDETKRQRFRDEYLTFLKKIREKNPDVPILCMYGQMISSSYDLYLDKVVQKATEEGMKDIYYMRLPQANTSKFGKGLGGHPSYKSQENDAVTYVVPKIKEILHLS